MLCQRCHKNEATVHIKNNINGQVTELMLCPECAEKENITSFFQFPTDSLFSGFFNDSVFGNDYLPTVKKCPFCGATSRDLARTGKVGCAKCYDFFGDEIAKIVYGIHGNAVHTGTRPGKQLKSLEKEKEIEQLKKEQSVAIAEQNYEKAAEIRDKIKEIQNRKENTGNGSET